MSKTNGRFAPSPSGPLHMGSLITALASYLDVTSYKGTWQVRIDDLDKPREVAGARDAILRSLHMHGLESAGPVQYQSEFTRQYEAAFQQLQDRIFYCDCTRASLKNTPVYPGRCRANTSTKTDSAVRLRARQQTILINDVIQPSKSINIEAVVGDVIIRRRDGPWAYNFATAIDDGRDFDRVLRGQDLAHVTPAQIAIMKQLGLETPTYIHIPVLCYPDGVKLSKQTGAPALDDQQVGQNLQHALTYLGQRPPAEPSWQPARWLEWARSNWDLHKIPAKLAVYDQHTTPHI